jgi:RNA-directed DNA polymerase
MPSQPLSDLWPRLTSFVSLHAAALNAQRGKRYRPAVLSFNARLEANLFRLQHELRSFTHTPGPYRDRELHHALCAAIVPPLERRFIATTYANRQGFGSHKALRCFVAECISRPGTSPSTPQRPSRWKGFPREHRRGPDPLP